MASKKILESAQQDDGAERKFNVVSDDRATYLAGQIEHALLAAGRPDIEIDAVEFQSRIDASLNRVLHYLQERGIELQKRPRIIFVNEYSPVPGQLAQANIEAQQRSALLEYLEPHVLSGLYADFNLRVSAEAIEEYMQRYLAEVSDPTSAIKRFPYPGDVVVYKNLADEPEKLDETIFHEVWHLVESEKVQDEKGRFIIEGTTTFAEHHFAQKPLEALPEERDLRAIAYTACAHIVAEEVDRESDPLTALLNPALRSRIGERFHCEYFPELVDVLKHFIVSNPVMAVIVMQRDPAYADFLHTPNKGNYIQALRSKGYPLLASELEKQDLEDYIHWIQAGMQE